jgi:hypothetical protein
MNELGFTYCKSGTKDGLDFREIEVSYFDGNFIKYVSFPSIKFAQPFIDFMKQQGQFRSVVSHSMYV